MGKPYQAELELLSATTAEVLEFDIKPLVRAVEDVSAHGVIVVASGGSQIAAHYLAHLHQSTFGHPCRVVTPLVFGHDSSLARGHVWLLSAGGSNGDILGALEHAIEASAKSITALVATLGSPLESLLRDYGSGRTFSYALSAGADGFLATNSLWSMCLLIERAYRSADDVEIAAAASAAIEWAPAAAAGVSDWDGMLVGLADPDTLIGLHDLEMRLTEAALAPVWVSDLRNLGHGRHYWFETHRARTRALCLHTRRYDSLARDTLTLLGSVSPVHDITVPGTGAMARLASIAWSMHAALALGRLLGRDPGRPGVPAFGEALYGLVAPRIKTDVINSTSVDLVALKLGRSIDRIDETTRSMWQAHLATYRRSLAASEIRAVVADFDGTLIETASRYEPLPDRIVSELIRLLRAGIPVGVATGRGDSCGDALRNALPDDLWASVWVGYHNGGFIQRLEVREVPDCPAVPAAPDIEEAYQRLQHLVVGTDKGRVRRYPTQCSMTLLDGSSLEQAWTRARAALDDMIEGGRVRVWMSSHSIDVVLGHVTKRAVVSELASAANCLPRNVLTVGDRGRWPGNDADLLDHPLSLSADECSLAPDRCWNLAGPRRRQVAATCYYLSCLTVTKSGVARFEEPDYE